MKDLKQEARAKEVVVPKLLVIYQGNSIQLVSINDELQVIKQQDLLLLTCTSSSMDTTMKMLKRQLVITEIYKSYVRENISRLHSFTIPDNMSWFKRGRLPPTPAQQSGMI